MIRISRNEAMKLNKMGVPFGEGGISHTLSKRKKYYLCENDHNLKLLDKIRK